MKNTDTPEPGTVYITGAGPGDPDLITLKGKKVLQRADVVVYDRLANPVLLGWTPSRSEHIYVGKRPDKPSVSQGQINRILVAKAREGKTVVRLKGGDPFVFGRGAEECEALRSHGVPYEVIPGISSALSAPAYAGIPVTHRSVSRSFTVVTGHTLASSDPFENWENLAGADTLVVLMGLRNLPAIAERLQTFGKPEETPVAVIAHASRPEQSVHTGTLADIADRVTHLVSPATIVIGELARMHEQLAWFDPQRSGSDEHRVEPQETVATYAV
ncbi:MAG: uroporphyrinogen-III C-methyltransferase [Balneolaceae bacterium]